MLLNILTRMMLGDKTIENLRMELKMGSTIENIEHHVDKAVSNYWLTRQAQR